jgi:hypothetical protein
LRRPFPTDCKREGIAIFAIVAISPLHHLTVRQPKFSVS